MFKWNKLLLSLLLISPIFAEQNENKKKKSFVKRHKVLTAVTAGGLVGGAGFVVYNLGLMANDEKYKTMPLKDKLSEITSLGFAQFKNAGTKCLKVIAGKFSRLKKTKRTSNVHTLQ